MDALPSWRTLVVLLGGLPMGIILKTCLIQNWVVQGFRKGPFPRTSWMIQTLLWHELHALRLMVEMERKLSSRMRPRVQVQLLRMQVQPLVAVVPALLHGETFKLGTNHTAYADLHDAAKALDVNHAMLYNTSRMSGKGSKQALLQCVTFHSYVQAVIVPVKQMDISRMRRIMAAFTALESLSCTGETL